MSQVLKFTPRVQSTVIVDFSFKTLVLLTLQSFHWKLVQGQLSASDYDCLGLTVDCVQPLQPETALHLSGPLLPLLSSPRPGGPGGRPEALLQSPASGDL